MEQKAEKICEPVSGTKLCQIMRSALGQMSAMSDWAKQNETIVLFGDYLMDGQIDWKTGMKKYPTVPYSELAMHCQITDNLVLALTASFRKKTDNCQTGLEYGKTYLSGLWILSLNPKTGKTEMTNGLPDELLEPEMVRRLAEWLQVEPL
jgi:hypothetical protein